MRGVIVSVVAVAALAAPAAASASQANDGIVGIELLSANIATTGNFTGFATGDLPGFWSATVVHQPLSNTTVSVTGGTFTLEAFNGPPLNGTIQGGSVTPTSSGSGCENRTFDIYVKMEVGSFSGVLTHYRRSFFGMCVTYSASIVGSAEFG